MSSLSLALASSASASMVDTIDRVQPKIVKIYGAGGFRGMEGYQSGILISPEGHILTAYSYVLDTDYDHRRAGRRPEVRGQAPGRRSAAGGRRAEDRGRGPALFRSPQGGEGRGGRAGAGVEQLFGVAVGDEPASVQKGTVSVVTRLEARRGVFETPYHGPVYVLDVTTNNPGAAGGALVTRRGELAGMLGKELRNSLNNTWLNYAVPIDELRQSVEEIRAGKFVARREPRRRRSRSGRSRLASLGIVLVPDVLERTPPYVDRVLPDSPAAKAGVRPDDLIVLSGDHLIQSCKALVADLEYVDYEDAVKLTVLRGQELLEFTLRPGEGTKPPKKGQP